jgi:iron complex transport system substrate-binding protein
MRRTTKKISLLTFALSIISILMPAYVFKNQTAAAEEKIVSVSGTATEVLCALGLEKNIIGVDVTSTYPASVQKLPKVGHNRSLNAEGILSLGPTLVVGMEEEFKPELKIQLEKAGIKVKLFKMEYTAQGSKSLITSMAAYFGKTSVGETLIKEIDQDLAKVKKSKNPKKVLFIYARGAGTMMVAGKNTSLERIIELAGGKNAVTGFEEFKPLTAESLVAANPDAILLFTSGLESLGGMDGFLKIQGVLQTNAGRNKKVIEMDGQYLSGFGPRVGKAAAELATKLQ